jgi:hypothetical protein
MKNLQIYISYQSFRSSDEPTGHSLSGSPHYGNGVLGNQDLVWCGFTLKKQLILQIAEQMQGDKFIAKQKM